jgi:hypothetical protein
VLLFILPAEAVVAGDWLMRASPGWPHPFYQGAASPSHAPTQQAAGAMETEAEARPVDVS